MSRSAVALPELDEDLDIEATEPRIQPVHLIIVYNDDDHTFEYVIDLFTKVFRYPLERCVQMAINIHEQGQEIVWSGMKEHGELKVEQLRSGGPDLWGTRRVEYPIQCTLLLGS